MGEGDKIREAVRKMWREHAEALRLIVEHRPQLADIREAYEKGIRKELGEVQFEYYPELRGELREIKFWIPDWWPSCPFTFMLHEDDGQLFTRVFIWREDYTDSAKRLKKWATATNAKSRLLIDEDFKSLPNWACWRRVFVEEDWPANAMLPVSDSDSETARSAVKRMLKLVKRLRKYVP